jgi:hypothetical protein
VDRRRATRIVEVEQPLVFLNRRHLVKGGGSNCSSRNLNHNQVPVQKMGYTPIRHIG